MIGRYWLAHHQFVSLLKAMDRGLLGLNLVYLAFIAFLPFPTALLGSTSRTRSRSPSTRSTSRSSAAMEVVLFRHAHRHGLLRQQVIPEDVYRFGVMMSLSPVLFFAALDPRRVRLSTTVAVCIWFLGLPFGIIAERLKPEGADELLLG